MTAGPAGVVAARARALAERREGFRRSLTARFWLRFHASLIVAGTFATGFMTNALLLQLPVHGIVLRWTIAILVGYAAFFVLVRLWLAYVGAKAWSQGDGSWIPVDGPSASPGPGGYAGGGGSSGGGGASAAWESRAGSVATSPSSTSSASSTSFGVADVDLGDGWLLIVLGAVAVAVVAVLFGSAVHLVWIAPELLSDAAFAALLATGAIPGLRRLREEGWRGAVWRRTWPALAGVLVVAWIAGLAFAHYFPGLRTLGEAWRMLR